MLTPRAPQNMGAQMFSPFKNGRDQEAVAR